MQWWSYATNNTAKKASIRLYEAPLWMVVWASYGPWGHRFLKRIMLSSKCFSVPWDDAKRVFGDAEPERFERDDTELIHGRHVWQR